MFGLPKSDRRLTERWILWIIAVVDEKSLIYEEFPFLFTVKLDALMYTVQPAYKVVRIQEYLHIVYDLQV